MAPRLGTGLAWSHLAIQKSIETKKRNFNVSQIGRLVAVDSLHVNAVNQLSNSMPSGIVYVRVLLSTTTSSEIDRVIKFVRPPVPDGAKRAAKWLESGREKVLAGES